MRHFNVIGTLIFFALLLVSTIRIASAQTPGNVHEKLSKKIAEELASGKAQDLIVVYNDKPVQKSAEELQSVTGLPSHHSRILEHKALKYAETKQTVLSSFTADESVELRAYRHLPVSFLRIHSQKVLDRLLTHPNVSGVYENSYEQKFLAESLPLIGQPQVAAQGNLGAGTAVAVLDTGVDYTKSAFGSCTSPGVPASCRVVYAQDFAPGDGKLDNDGHGTNVAGIVAGVAPGAKIIALDVFSGSPQTGNLGAATSDILNAIDWVITNKATYNIVAINMSLGSGKYTAPVTNGAYNAAVVQARAAGILTVAAAGNDGYLNALSQPAATSGVISVGAVYDSALGTLNWGNPLRCTDTNSAADKVTCFSNSSSFLTMLAPGSQILAAGITEGGTSQAAPHVAGAVAVLRAAHPNETLDQTVARLTSGVMVTDSKNDIAKPRLSLPMALGLDTTCSYTVAETGRSFSSLASSGSITVTAGAGCTWSAASSTGSASWITITSGTSGSGSGTVQYSVAANGNSTARTGTITVAGQMYTINQSGSTGAVSNILLNPGFENGPVSWTENSVSGYPIITSYLSPTTSNSWYAWLCGYNNCSDTLSQDVTIPADAQSAYVQFSYSITTDETPGPTAYDSMTVRVYSPPDAKTYTYWTLSNLNATAVPVLSPTYDVSAFKGQTIRLQFSATTDTSFITNFFIDDVTLMVSGSTPDTQAPSVPSGLTAAAGSAGVINLSWNAATDNISVTAYKLYRSGSLLTNLGNVTSYSNTGLSSGTTYSYTVSACDAAGNCSAQSTACSATTIQTNADTTPPAVPAGLTATPLSISTIQLTWSAANDNVGVTSYNVYRNGTLLTAAGSTSYSDSGLTPSTTYSYTVSACDAAGNCSVQSPAVLATTSAPFSNSTPVVMSGPSSYQVNGNIVDITIGKITNNSFSGHSGSLKLELWALKSPYFGGSTTGYVTASIRTKSIQGATDTLAALTSFTNITLSLPFTTAPADYSNYALFLMEYNPLNCTAADHFCIIDYINYHEILPPSAPTAVSATAISSSQIALAWNASSDNVGVTNYRVYRDGNLISLLGNVTSSISGGLAASTQYSFTVSACDAAGNCSAQSTATSARTADVADMQAPATPTGFTVSAISSTRINLAWSASSDNVGVTAYKVYSGGGLVDTLGPVTSTFRTVVPATSYSYSVAACDAAGNCSAQCAPQSATTPAAADTQAPTVPDGVTATPVSSSQIDLSWTASTDNVGVTAYRISSSDGQTIPVGNITNYNHTGLRTATAYSYTVAACDTAGNCSAQSTSASATTNGTIVTVKAGDCDNSGTVTIAEVQSAINMFLGLTTVTGCVDVDGSGSVTIAEVQKVINSFLGL